MRRKLVRSWRRTYLIAEPIEELDFVLDTYVDPALAGLRKAERAERRGRLITYSKKRDRVAYTVKSTTRFSLDAEPEGSGTLLTATGPEESPVWDVLGGLGSLQREELLLDPALEEARQRETRKAALEAERAAAEANTPDVGAPEGWYPYRVGKVRERWWNGVAWTDDVRY